MDSSRHSRRRATWLLASLSSLLLAAGSVAFAASASADPSPQGQSHSAEGQAHAAAAGSSAAAPGRTKAAAKPARSGQSSVSLSRPNDFQAQADPDGMDNGGVDQPGGQGGVDTTSQDGNNGSGNDTDCEDDNRGVGVPGHCKDRTDAPVGDTPDVPRTDTDSPVVPEPDLPIMSSDSSSDVQVLAPQLSPYVASASATGSTDTPRTLSDAAPAAVAGVLPNTGAGEALLALALAGLAALVVGGGLLLQGRHTTS